jgi:nucleoid DNA-binding protein
MAKRTAKKRSTKRTATKKTTKKRTTRKPATRRAAATSTSAATSPSPAAQGKLMRLNKADSPRSKSEVLSLISDHVGITKKDVQHVFDSMAQIIKKDLSKQGPGEFKVPGMMKITVQRKPATKARKGINPFTGEETTFKAKPARNVVKVRPLKGLKELV